MVRKVLFWSFGLVAVVALGGYLLLFPPLPRPPEIAQGLPSNFAKADEEFARRILAAFQSPITVEELVDRLSEQGFTVHEDSEFAIFEKSKFPCTLGWRVYWEAEDGSVSNLKSKYGGACL